MLEYHHLARVNFCAMAKGIWIDMQTGFVPTIHLRATRSLINTVQKHSKYVQIECYWRQKWTDDLDAISTQFMFGSQVYPSWLVTVVSHTIIIVSFSKKRRSKNGELRNAAADFCPG